jgi:hypothetical protein
MTLDGYEGPEMEVTSGLPQESAVSPIDLLFILPIYMVKWRMRSMV